MTLLAVGAVLAPLERLVPARASGPQKRGTVLLNLAYWFFTPAFTKALTSAIIAVLFLVLFLAQRGRDRPVARGRVRPAFAAASVAPDARNPARRGPHRLLDAPNVPHVAAVAGSTPSTTVEEMTWPAAGRMHPVNDAVTRVCQVILHRGGPVPRDVRHPAALESEVGLRRAAVCPGQPGVTPKVAPHERRGGDRQELRRHLPDLRHPVRNVLLSWAPRAAHISVRRPQRLRWCLRRCGVKCCTRSDAAQSFLSETMCGRPGVPRTPRGRHRLPYRPILDRLRERG